MLYVKQSDCHLLHYIRVSRTATCDGSESTLPARASAGHWIIIIMPGIRCKLQSCDQKNMAAFRCMRMDTGTHHVTVCEVYRSLLPHRFTEESLLLKCQYQCSAPTCSTAARPTSRNTCDTVHGHTFDAHHTDAWITHSMVYAVCSGIFKSLRHCSWN